MSASSVTVEWKYCKCGNLLKTEEELRTHICEDCK